MFLIYADESGSADRHSEPLLSGQTPLFVLGSLILHADGWRSIDRAYRDLKGQFFSKEIGRGRAELYEVKGSDLIKPSNRDSRRRHTFVRRVLTLCSENQMAGFMVAFKKNATRPTSRVSMYNMALQYLSERFSCFLEETHAGLTPGFEAQPAQGIIVADSRMRNLDLNVATSHLSFIFGHPVGQQCLRLIEAPTFTHSELSVGIQLTDIFAACLYARLYRRHCRTIAGAVDYSHTAYADDYLDALEWHGRRPFNGYMLRGYRFIDHSVPP
jgi:uncharacterized protein DUF3800